MHPNTQSCESRPGNQNRRHLPRKSSAPSGPEYDPLPISSSKSLSTSGKPSHSLRYFPVDKSQPTVHPGNFPTCFVLGYPGLSPNSFKSPSSLTSALCSSFTAQLFRSACAILDVSRQGSDFPRCACPSTGLASVALASIRQISKIQFAWKLRRVGSVLTRFHFDLLCSTETGLNFVAGATIRQSKVRSHSVRFASLAG